MGQSASKANKVAERAARKAVDSAPKPPSPPTPPPVQAKNTSINTKANNPAMFLRGTGFSTEDVRDRGQELYLQTRHNIDDEKKAKGPQDMPDDLLKFIQDVGPATQAVDREFTTPRLLENEEELNKAESVRKVTRDRLKMPLMDGDNTFTTTRNTNFSRVAGPIQGDAKEFGLSNLQLYQLISKKDEIKKSNADSFYESIVAQEDTSNWTDKEKATHKQLLTDALASIEIPILRMDTDGNFFGLRKKDVPAKDVMAIQPIPESKVKLVLQHLSEVDEQSGDIATAKLERRRELRKANARS